MRRLLGCCLLLAGLLPSCGGPSPVPVPLQVADRTSQRQELFAGGHDLFEGDGRKVKLHGFNYFGFNSGTTMVDGLWGGPPVAVDFASVVHRQRQLGFNAVRLPFSFHDLLEATPKIFSQPCRIPTTADIARSVTRPGGVVPARIDPLPYPPHRTAGQCNSYLPNDTVWNRFKWVVSFYAKNGFYVLIDNHLREDSTALQDPERWSGLWAKLVRELAADPDVRRRMMVDLLNEPDAAGIRWEATPGKPSLAALYLQAMDAIDSTGVRPLFFIEGTGQAGLQVNWGDGFDTDNVDISTLGLSNPRPFFAQLLTRRYRRQVVLAPHVYGPAVTGNRNAFEGKSLTDRLTRSFGGLMQRGFCAGGSKCVTFPVALGEFGSKLEQAEDVQTMQALRDYMLGQSDGKDGEHFAVKNWFWWSWNANSGDTGGLVQDDWVTLNWNKLDFLRPLGLEPAGG